MASYQRPAGGPALTDELKVWATTGSDSDRPRQTMGTTLRSGLERSSGDDVHKKRKPSRRVATSSATVDVPQSHSHHRHSSRDYARAMAPVTSHYGTSQTQNHATTSSRARPPDALYGVTEPRSALRTPAEATSSNERLFTSEQTRNIRAAGYPAALVATSTAQVIPTYPYADPASRASRDPSASARQHKERDREREKETSGGHRDKDRDRERAGRESEYALASGEAVEHERRRRKEKDKERSGKDKQKSKDRERPSTAVGSTGAVQETPQMSRSIPTQRAPFADYNRPAPATLHDSNVQQFAYATAQQPGPSVPASTTAMAQPPAFIAPNNTSQLPTSTRSQQDVRSITHRTPAATSEREKPGSKHHRSNRDRLLAHQSGQDSGMSSSEQEQPARERPRTSERRHALRTQLMDSNNPSGPSGSETERQSIRERRKFSRTHGEVFQSRSGPEAPMRASTTALNPPQPQASERQSSTPPISLPQDSLGQRLPIQESPDHRGPHTLLPQTTGTGYMPTSQRGQPNPTVGPATSQRSRPQIVSIRAGQGPADPQSPFMIPKAMTPTTLTRPLESAGKDHLRYPSQQSVVQVAFATGQHTAPSNTPQPSTTSGHVSARTFTGGVLGQPAQATSTTYPITQPSSRGHIDGSSLHPVQQAIRSLDGITRPPSTAPTPLAQTTRHVPATATSSAYIHPSGGNKDLRAPAPDVSSRFPINDGSPPGIQQAAQELAGGGNTRVTAEHSAYAVAPGITSSSRSVAHASDATATRSPVSGYVVPQKQGSTDTAPTSRQQIGLGGSETRDPRSPKPPGAVMSTHAVFAAAGPPEPSYHHTSTGQPRGDPSANATYNSASAAFVPPLSGSPSRQTQSNVLRSPVPPYANTPGSAANTPKQSPSARLHTHRNGSSDTILQSPAMKPSPPIGTAGQPLGHRPSATNLRSYSSPRPDTISSARPTNVTPGYPEPTRYRSPAPVNPQYVSTSQHASGYANGYPHTYMHSTQSTSRPSNTLATPAAAPVSQVHRQPNPQASGSRPQDQSRNTSASNAAYAGQRGPPRSASSPVPVSSTRQYYDMVVPAQSSSAPPRSQPVQPVRTNTYPAPTGRPAPSPAPAVSHSRAMSDSQHTPQPLRPALANNPLSNTRGRSQSASRAPPSPTPEQDPLRTPSSLAPSMLPVGPVPVSTKPTKQKAEKDKEPRKGMRLFRLFRSISSPPKHDVRATAGTATPAPQKAPDQLRARSTSQTSTAPVVGLSRPSANVPQSAPARSVAFPQSSSQVTIAAPVPMQPQDPRAAGSKMFTPFRLLSRRHRSISSASAEAVDGTAANTVLTGASSVRSSTAGRPSPPLRDPMAAAQEWRNKEEEEFYDRGTGRRRRPGVTFEVGENPTEEMPRLSRRPTRRQPVPAFDQQ